MDFDKFLEKDIIEFLDEQSRQVAEKAEGLREEEFDLYEITQDYTKEINDALKEGDLIKAKKVFDDVKEKYSKATPGTLSKKRLYIIMEEIYEKIKDYEDKEKGKKSLFDTIKDYEQKGLFKRPEMFEQRHTQSADLILGIIARKEKQLENLTSKKVVTAEDMKKAIKDYREIKSLVMKIPNSYPKEKAKVFESALSWYYTLKKLKQELHQRESVRKAKEKAKEEPAEEAKPRPMLEHELARVRDIKREIVESHEKIAGYLRKKDLLKSIDEYRNLKKLCESFPNEMEEEKTALLADALSLYESIKKLKDKLEERKIRGIGERIEQTDEKKGRDELRKDIRNKIGLIKDALARSDVARAKGEYQELSHIFKQYPSDRLEEKKDLYNEIVQVHKDIKTLEGQGGSRPGGAQPRISRDNRNKAKEIEACLEEARNQLDKGEAEQATHKLLEAKHKIQMLPDDSFDDKYRLLKEMEKLEHQTLFVKNIRNINDPSTISS